MFLWGCQAGGIIYIVHIYVSVEAAMQVHSYNTSGSQFAVIA